MMAWDDTSYPASMGELPPDLRARAIELANALLDDGFDEERAVRLAVEVVKALAEPPPAARGARPH